jgi:hypothetical protein
MRGIPHGMSPARETEKTTAPQGSGYTYIAGYAVEPELLETTKKHVACSSRPFICVFPTL